MLESRRRGKSHPKVARAHCQAARREKESEEGGHEAGGSGWEDGRKGRREGGKEGGREGSGAGLADTAVGRLTK